MSPKSTLRMLLSFILLLIGGRIIYVSTYKKQSSQPQICCNSTCFTLELAQTPTERKIGLMFRKYLPEDAGMLFIFPTEQQYSFWMKNTLIPLDMLRLNADFQIVDLQEAQPCTTDLCPSYVPISEAQYVLELNQGMSKKSGIEIGNQCFLVDA